MSSINITKARKDLYRLVQNVVETNKEITITGKKGSAVLISESDWRSIQETIYLLSIPGMRESILEGMKEDPNGLSEEPGW